MASRGRFSCTQLDKPPTERGAALLLAVATLLYLRHRSNNQTGSTSAATFLLCRPALEQFDLYAVELSDLRVPSRLDFHATICKRKGPPPCRR